LQSRNEKVEYVKLYIKDHQNDFYRLACSYTKNSEDALDVIQESVYKAIKNADKLKSPEYIKTWMYRIVVNESIDFLRKNKVYSSDILEEINIQHNDRDITTSITLYSAIENLSPKEKTVIILRFFEDMKLEEIAEITKTNVSTVKSRLYKALRELKNTIGSVLKYE